MCTQFGVNARDFVERARRAGPATLSAVVGRAGDGFDDDGRPKDQKLEGLLKSVDREVARVATRFAS